jgi:O-succinylbenzoate synthase
MVCSPTCSVVMLSCNVKVCCHAALVTIRLGSASADIVGSHCGITQLTRDGIALQEQECQFIGQWSGGAFVSGKWIFKDGSVYDGGFNAESRPEVRTAALTWLHAGSVVRLQERLSSSHRAGLQAPINIAFPP